MNRRAQQPEAEKEGTRISKEQEGVPGRNQGICVGRPWRRPDPERGQGALASGSSHLETGRGGVRLLHRPPWLHTLLNSTGLNTSIRSENSFWMLLSRLVSMGALDVLGGRRGSHGPPCTPGLLAARPVPRPPPQTWACSWVRSGPAAGSCCTPRRFSCSSRCSAPCGRPPRTGAPPGGQRRYCSRHLQPPRGPGDPHPFTTAGPVSTGAGSVCLELTTWSGMGQRQAPRVLWAPIFSPSPSSPLGRLG